MHLISLMRDIWHGKGSVLLFTAALLVLFCAGAGAAPKTEDCLECHDAYQKYSHGGVACVDCHSAITSLPHADKLPQPACVVCHEKTANSFSRSLHAERGLACASCHNAHFPQKDKKYCASCHANASHGTLPSSKKHLEQLMCIACHGKVDRTEVKVHVEIKGGKELRASAIDRDGNGLIDQAEWHALEDLLHTGYKGRYIMEKTYQARGDSHTVTAKPAACDACHGSTGHFATGRLQVTGRKNLEIPLDTRIFIPELPSAKEFGRTVHGRAGVVCADCHLSQRRIAEGGSENVHVCRKCHEAQQDVYSRSVHVRVGATHCVDCHNPHRITSYKELGAKARMAVCSRCHKDYVRRHAWLPNTSLHFDYLECATCHSPQSKKSLVFYFVRKSPAGKAKLSYNELVALTGQDPTRAFGERQGSPDTQIARLFTLLAQRDKNVTIDASIIVTKAYHDYSETHLRERQCVTCHSREAHFYDSMLLLLPGRDSSTYIPVKGTLLAKYPIGTSVDFFLVGEEKMKKDDVYKFLHLRGRWELGLKLIDFFGFMTIIVVLVGVAAHVVLRLTVRK